MIKFILSMLSIACLAQGVLVYHDNKVIEHYADDLGISKGNLYALTHKWDKCPEDTVYFDSDMGICWNASAVEESQSELLDPTDTGVGM